MATTLTMDSPNGTATHNSSSLAPSAAPTVAASSSTTATPMPKRSRKTKEEERNLSPSQRMVLNLIAGAGSGAITKTSVAPFDRVKILHQVQGMMHSSGPKYSNSVIQTLQTIVKEEGPLALYKGNGVNVLRVIPVYALKFSFNDSFTEMVKKPGQTRADLNFTQLMIAGSFAGLFQATITYPLEVVRTRLSFPPKFGGTYKGIADCFRRVVKEEGYRALYKGYGATVLSGGPYVGLQMSFYEMYKRLYPKDEHGDSTLFWKLAGGASAGLSAQFVTFPLDTTRRRMQSDGMAGRARQYTSTVNCVSQVYRKEGLLAFYRGLNATVWRVIPGAAIQFAAYDTLKSFIIAQFDERERARAL